tara:strand:- start:11610 stop:11834 length:225 start_codon:yes stop_codon:yes gene_type:complete
MKKIIFTIALIVSIIACTPEEQIIYVVKYCSTLKESKTVNGVTTFTYYNGNSYKVEGDLNKLSMLNECELLELG